MEIRSFKGEYAFLSNMWLCRIEYKGFMYNSVEHAYQAAKAGNRKDWMYVKTAPTPKLAKLRAREIVVRKDFYNKRLAIMEECLIQKFSIPRLKIQLMSTGEVELIEGNWWKDYFWGVCNGKGENHLGKLLMKIRANLR